MAVNHLVTGSNPVGGAIYFLLKFIKKCKCGEMPEWSNGTVLKTVVSQGTQGSNPCFSAIFFTKNFKLEGCQSGWTGSPAKGVNLYGFRGFESHPVRHLGGPVAQGLEHSAHNRLVAGSIPARPTIPKISYFVENFKKSFDKEWKINRIHLLK